MRSRIATGDGMRRAFARALALLLGFAASPTGALAQTSYECSQLLARIGGVTPGMSAQGSRYAEAARKQQYELDRTASYAQSIGCNNRQFLIFGNPPPPQCGGLQAQIQRMRANLSTLQSQARAGDGDAQRQALQARYDSMCRQARGGLFDSLFGGDRQQVPLDPLTPDAPPADDRARGGSLAVCVRTCDGGFFPVSYSARRAKLGALEELCKAQCPGAETALYTMAPSASIDTAISTDGEPYTDLENAGKFRKKFDAACGCKPGNKSWVEALAQAEELLGRQSRNDLIVTPEKSEELSRPRTERAAANPPAPTPDKTGSTPPGPVAPPPAYGLRDGEHRETSAAGGGKKIRIIGPKL